MIIFAFICLVALVLTAQHVLNFLWRRLTNKHRFSQSDIAGWVLIMVILTIVTGILTYIGFKYIIEWGQLL